MKPILFNTDMVRAILDGRKTVTRRIAKDIKDYLNCTCNTRYYFDSNNHVFYCMGCGYPLMRDGGFFLQSPYQPGDILYVRETWSPVFVHPKRYLYKADVDAGQGEGVGLPIKWHPSIHMPKEAARIFIRVTDVRVEQLQEISGGELLNEGVDLFQSNFVRVAFDEFSTLWDSTISKKELSLYGWDANPWVWVIEFERCEKPLQNAGAGADATQFADQPVLMPAT